MREYWDKELPGAADNTLLIAERVESYEDVWSFDDRRRDEVLQYTIDKYGRDKVAQVITFGKIKTKAAIKDAARVHHGQPGFAIADKISKALPPPISAKDIPANALYRPGPMEVNAHLDYADRKNGRKPVQPIHQELDEPFKDILAETYGLIVYQEQIMAIAQRVAGYSSSCPSPDGDCRLVGELKRTLRAHSGSVPVHVKVQGSRGVTRMALSSDYFVSTDKGLQGELKGLLGAGCFES